jgi:hypothetical protein
MDAVDFGIPGEIVAEGEGWVVKSPGCMMHHQRLNLGLFNRRNRDGLISSRYE